jgi:hypothetical protein
MITEQINEWKEKMIEQLEELSTMDEKIAFLDGIEFEQKHGSIKLLKGDYEIK